MQMQHSLSLLFPGLNPHFKFFLIDRARNLAIENVVSQMDYVMDTWFILYFALHLKLHFFSEIDLITHASSLLHCCFEQAFSPWPSG